MADPAKLQAAEAEAARAQEAAKAAAAKESAIFREQRQVNAELRSIKAKIQDPNVPESEKAALTERGQALETQYNQLEQQGLQATQAAQAAAAQARQAESDLRTQQQATDATSANNGAVSSGDTVAEAARARDDGATSVTPQAAPDVLTPEGRIESATPTTAPSNAEKFTPSADTLPTTPPVTTVTTQATPAPPSVAQTPGNRTDEDSESPGEAQSRATNATQAAIDRKFGGVITPRPNVLDGYASYTYTISIYLMSPDDYKRLLSNKQKYLAGFQLLMQSGGAPLESGVVPQPDFPSDTGGTPPPNAPSLTQGRNQFFPLDYYIDNLRLKSFISGKGTRGSHNVVEMSFRIVEPYGITLFENLYNAVQQYVTFGGGSGSSVPQNYAAQNYLMVIRFYGYDQTGKLMAPKTVDPFTTTDRQAISEKFIPFRFTGIKFRIANRLTEYECHAVCPQNDIGTGQGRGVIPYNMELTATTLKNLLSGNRPISDDPSAPPPKANTASQPAIVSGLAEALNKYQRELVERGVYNVPDEYVFKIVEPELQNSRVRPPGQVVKQNVGMTQAQTAAQAKDGAKQTANTDSKNVSATAGMPIVQFLDLAVRNSTYIYDQQTKIKTEDGKTIPQGSASTPAWFRIGVETSPLAYDEKRNDNAFRITYQISMYRVSQIKSDYFPEGRFRGTHKKYNYWFTGENTQILKFEQDFNYLFYLTVNTDQGPREIASTASYREYEKRVFAPNSPESSQGNPGNINEPGANAADYLYSPGDQAELKIEIVGDPAWIQQGEVWSGIGGVGVTDPAAVAFLPDGTINYESQEVLFEIGFNKPSDYNIQTGIMEITRRSG